MLDETASFVISSSTDGLVTIHDIKTKLLMAKAECGDLTTGMCISQDKRFLLTASSEGAIYCWRLPMRLKEELSMRSPKHLKRKEGFSQTSENSLEESQKYIPAQRRHTISPIPRVAAITSLKFKVPTLKQEDR